VFVVASACEGFDPAAILLEFDGVRRDSPPSRSTPQDIAAGTLRSTDGGSDIDQARAGHIQPVAFGGNRTSGPIDVSPALLSHSGSKLDFESETFMVQQVAGTLTASYGDQCGRDLAEMPGGLQVAPIAFDSRQSPVSSYEVFGSLGSSSPQAQAVTYAIQAGALRTNPASGPDGVGVQTDIGYTLEARAEVQAVAHTLDASSGRSRGAGTPVGMLAPVCITGDITHTLKAEGFDASEDGTGRGQPIISVNALYGEDLARTLTAGAGKNSGISSGARDEPLQNGVMSGMAVRRLMPVECERLQGFPDGWTDIPLPGRRASDKPARMAADGPRYKALGNSWAVPNVYWIGKRIHDQLMKLEIA
jgi:DNA (cytosine-5)-methyltransferase 1